MKRSDKSSYLLDKSRSIMIILFFISGLCIGSFLNVCICRIPARISLISPPSSCGSCGHRLSYIDMLPVVNYVLLRGKCRYCKTNFSIQYPLIELLNGIIYLLIVLKYGASIYSGFLCSFVSVLIVVSIIDLKHMIIPDSVIATGVVIGLSLLIYDRTTLVDKLIGLLFGLVLFLIIALLTGAMGGGDIKLMGTVGLMFGVKGVVFISLFSFIIGAAISVILLSMKIKSRKDKIPFGPFISLASLLYVYYGREMIAVYFNLLF